MNSKSSSKNTFLKNQIPAIFWAMLIITLTSMPNLKGPDLGFDFQDKIGHFIFYGIFGILLGRALHFQNVFSRLSKYYLIYAILTGIIFGLVDEYHQKFIPGRDMDFFDFIADSTGIISGILLFQYRKKLSGIIDKREIPNR